MSGTVRALCGLLAALVSGCVPIFDVPEPLPIEAPAVTDYDPESHCRVYLYGTEENPVGRFYVSLNGDVLAKLGFRQYTRFYAEAGDHLLGIARYETSVGGIAPFMVFENVLYTVRRRFDCAPGQTRHFVTYRDLFAARGQGVHIEELEGEHDYPRENMTLVEPRP